VKLGYEVGTVVEAFSTIRLAWTQVEVVTVDRANDRYLCREAGHPSASPNGLWTIPGYALRPVQPVEPMGSWDKVERITGWRPHAGSRLRAVWQRFQPPRLGSGESL
jgi:hypothetical protein